MNGTIRKRGKHSWQLIFDLPRGVDGKRRQARHTVHGTKKDAQGKLRELLTGLGKGEYVAPNKETVASFLLRWLDTYVATTTNPRTEKDYRGIIERYLIPTLGFSPNPPKDTDGRGEDSGRGWVRELQGRWPGVLG